MTVDAHLTRAEVGIALGAAEYSDRPPYGPCTKYPEYAFDDADGNGEAYGLVREALHALGLDAARFGSADWDPLGEILKPGDTVVLKPNFVRDFRETHDHHGYCLITHGSVIRAVLDCVHKAIRGEGRIVVADAPQNDADFDAIRRITGLDAIQSFYRDQAGFEVEVYDLRPERARKIDGVIVGHEKLSGDPRGYARVDLGRRSAFMEVNELCHLLYGAEYKTDELHSHQHDDVHEYLISKTVLEADCVISLPKLKTHKKTGITVNMKNLVGINGNKNWLPHHREGTPSQGGDQFAESGVKQRLERATMAKFKCLFPLLGPLRPLVAGPIKAAGKRIFGDTNTGTIRSGNWYGNDTTWRMVIDLNRILHFADAEGTLHEKPMRRFFSVVDGIIAGEGNGPLDPTAKRLGMIFAGFNPVAVDLACARVMGFDHARLPVLFRTMEAHSLPLVSFARDEVRVQSEDARLRGPLDEIAGAEFAFKAHSGWVGHIETRNEGRMEEASCAG